MLILIAGKQRSLRNALRGFLRTQTGYEVSGTVADKKALLTAVETNSPDILLLDEDFAELLVEEILVPVQQLNPCPQVIVLINRVEGKMDYLDAGAATLVSKTRPPKQLLIGIETVRLRSRSV